MCHCASLGVKVRKKQRNALYRQSDPLKGPFINDVKQYEPEIDPPSSSVTLKWVFYLHIYAYRLKLA